MSLGVLEYFGIHFLVINNTLDGKSINTMEELNEAITSSTLVLFLE